MYSNSEILEIIHNDESYYQAVQNITKSDELTDDLYSELLIIIGEEDNEKLNGMLDRNELKWFWVRVCMNQWNSTNSPFYYKYRKDRIDTLNRYVEEPKFKDNNHHIPLNYDMELERLYKERDEDDITYEEPYSRLVRRVTEETLNEMYWYKSKLFRLYVKLGSYRAVSESTMIPARTIGDTCREVKEELKQAISDELNRLGR